MYDICIDPDKACAEEHIARLRRDLETWCAAELALDAADIPARAEALITSYYDETLAILANQMQQTWYAVMVNELRAAFRPRLRQRLREQREQAARAIQLDRYRLLRRLAVQPPQRDDDATVVELAAVLDLCVVQAMAGASEEEMRHHRREQASLFYREVVEARLAADPMTVHALLKQPDCRLKLGEEAYHHYRSRMTEAILRGKPVEPAETPAAPMVHPPGEVPVEAVPEPVPEPVLAVPEPEHVTQPVPEPEHGYEPEHEHVPKLAPVNEQVAGFVPGPNPSILDRFPRWQRHGRTIHIYIGRLLPTGWTLPTLAECVSTGKRLWRGFVPARARRTCLPTPVFPGAG